MCVVNCTSVPHAAGQNDNASCLCITGFEWVGGACVRNCTADVYAVGLTLATQVLVIALVVLYGMRLAKNV